jgi:hypothetical protein
MAYSPFKMKGRPIIQGTNSHKSALKQKQATISSVSDSLQNLPNPAAEKLRKEYEEEQKRLHEEAQKKLDANTDSTNAANQAELEKRAKEIQQNVSPKDFDKQVEDFSEKNSPAKHKIGKEAHDSAHAGTHPTANTFINDQHDTQEQLDRKKLAKKKTTKSSPATQRYIGGTAKTKSPAKQKKTVVVDSGQKEWDADVKELDTNPRYKDLSREEKNAILKAQKRMRDKGEGTVYVDKNKNVLPTKTVAKKQASPSKWVQFIPMALSAMSSMKKDKEE